MGPKSLSTRSLRRPVRSVARHGYLFLPGGAVGLPGGVVGLPGGAVGLWLALADGVAVAGAGGVVVGGAEVGGAEVGLGGAGDDLVGLGPPLGWPGKVITASTVLRSVGVRGPPEGRPLAVADADGRPVVSEIKGPLQLAGEPKEPANKAMPIAAKKKRTVELPDHAAARVPSNLRPVSSTKTGDFANPSLGVRKGESVCRPSHLTRQC